MTLSRVSYLVSYLLPLFTCSMSHAQNAAFLPKFRADSQLVLVPVTVTDHYGKTVEGLRQENFTVLDDQSPQRIVSFSTADAPCSVGLVLDISGSMRDSLHTAKEVTRAFLGTANPGALAAIEDCFARLRDASLWVTRRNSIAASLREAS